ncbi:MAG: type VI secretion system Vgr family protein [Gemmataceae bacterium]
MANFSQQNRPLAIATPLGPDVLLAEKLDAREAVSELFEYRLQLLAEKPVPFDQLLGQEAKVQLQLPNGDKRYFNGMIAELSQGGRVSALGDAALLRYESLLVPKIWLLTCKVQSRIFQHMDTPAILKEVLSGYQVKYELVGTYYKREYCVQYRESDFDFISRLMEEEGIYYFFEQSESGHELVLCDSHLRHGDISGDSKVAYDTIEARRGQSHVTNWKKSQRIRPGKVTLRDYHFELPDSSLEAESLCAEDVQAGSVQHKLTVGNSHQLEIYHYPGYYAHRFDGIDKGGSAQPDDLQEVFKENQRTVRLRIEEESAQAVRIAGSSVCGRFLPGLKFKLEKHFDGDGEYWLSRVQHRTSTIDYLTNQEAPFEYANDFECLPAKVQYRTPLQTPRPRIEGTQTAVVVGPPGEHVFVDKYGRVKVQFHWDRQGKNNADSSRWIRVAQVWAGNRWGAFFWPRIGQEVVVDFHEGDPDQPIIVGSVYNAKQMPPFDLPGDVTLTGIKSCSVGGSPSANFNGVLFCDKLGDEHVEVHSETHDIHKSESTHWTRVGDTHVFTVGGMHLGSGAGAGELDSSGAGAGDDPGSYYWKASVPGSLGKNLQMTIGAKLETILGFDGEYVLGDYAEVIINPIGYAGQFGGESASTGSVIAKGLGAAFGGSIEFTYGTDTSIVYGPKVEIHRGVTVENTANFGEATLPIKIMAGLTGAMAMANMIVGAFDADSEGAQIAQFTTLSASGLAFAALNALESKVALVKKAEDAAKQDQEAALLAKNFTTIPVALQAVAALAYQAQDAAAEAAAAAAAAATEAAESRDANASRTQTISGRFFLNAYNMMIQAAPPADAPAGALISINASGADDLPGRVLVNGSDLTSITAGPCFTTYTKQDPAGGSITTQCGEAGQVKIQTTGLPTAPRIELDAEGISLTVGPPGAGASITLNESGIYLRFAEWEIALDEGGIQLLVGDNSIDVSEAAIEVEGSTINLTTEGELAIEASNVDIDADAYELLAATLEETVAGNIERSAGIMEVN